MPNPAPTSNAIVPFVELGRAHAGLRDELGEAFERVVDSSAFVLGAEVQAFEAEWAAYCGTRHAVGVASGTAALTIALRAARIGAGDEVILPAHTFIATALAVLAAGAVPVLCDVDAERGLIDPASAEAAVTPRTAAIVPVHLYGQPADMDAICALAARHGLLVLEDAAQAHGAATGDRRAGSLGDVAAFSFYPSKNLGALGDGGALCTDDDEIAERARQLRHLGQRGKGEHELTGYNERLDGLQAALLRVKLPHLDAANLRRRELAALYAETLPGERLLTARDGVSDVFHLFPVRVPDRDDRASRLRDAGVQTGVHYSPDLSRQPPLVGAARCPVPLDHSNAWAAEELSLPMFAELSEQELERVAAAWEETANGNLGGKAS
jgi:dTDP-4-amino-4,6-dideoxygalactose transaminase